MYRELEAAAILRDSACMRYALPRRVCFFDNLKSNKILALTQNIPCHFHSEAYQRGVLFVGFLAGCGASLYHWTPRLRVAQCRVLKRHCARGMPGALQPGVMPASHSLCSHCQVFSLLDSFILDHLTLTKVQDIETRNVLETSTVSKVPKSEAGVSFQQLFSSQHPSCERCLGWKVMQILVAILYMSIKPP